MSVEDEEAGKAADADPSPANRKRPARTIDLKAEEVAETKPETGNGEPSDAPRPDNDAGSPKDTDENDVPDKEVSDPASQEKPDPKKLKGAKPPPPPQRTKPSDVKAFVTHLAAGLIGGLIGVVGAGVGLDWVAMSPSSGPAEPPQAVIKAESRLNALEPELKGLISRLDTLEARPAPEAGASDELAKRLDAFEERLAAISETAGGTSDGAGEQAAALSKRLDDFEERLSAIKEAGGGTSDGAGGQTAALSERLDKAEAALADLSAAVKEAVQPDGAGADPKVLETLSARVDQLKSTVSGLAERKPAAQVPAAAAPIAVGFAFESLRRAATAGTPFTAQLAALGETDIPQADLAPFKAWATSGVPAQANLLSAVPKLLKSVSEDSKQPPEGSFLERLASNASSLVRIRRVGSDASPGAAGSSGALKDAIEKVSSLDGAAANPEVSKWLSDARARVKLDTALSALEMKILDSLSPGQPEKG